MASAVEKPVLRGLLKRQVKFHFMGMLVTAVTAVSLVKHFYTDKRKRQHDEFWRLILQLNNLAQQWYLNKYIFKSLRVIFN